MSFITATDRDGEVHRLAVSSGDNLMEVLRDAGLSIEAICGGQCICSTCHVYIDAPWADQLPGRSDAEQVLVEDSGHFQENSRLSCQIDYQDGFDGLSLTLAPEY